MPKPFSQTLYTTLSSQCRRYILIISQFQDAAESGRRMRERERDGRTLEYFQSCRNVPRLDTRLGFASSPPGCKRRVAVGRKVHHMTSASDLMGRVCAGYLDITLHAVWVTWVSLFGMVLRMTSKFEGLLVCSFVQFGMISKIS